MRSLIAVGLGLTFALASIVHPRSASAQGSVVAADDDPWTREELENLLAPIALYPDPILAQVLVAATYPDQVQAASAYVKRYGSAGLDNQPWEISVRAVAHYAPVLNLMAEGEDWMIALGQAYAEQPRDVMDAVQSLRQMANAQGNLVSTEQQRVVVEREVIRIEPAQPRVIYVPTYDPAVIYFRPIHIVRAHPAYWSWGMAYPLGVWLTYDVDWWGHRVYYHGWHVGGPRWVVVSRPFVVISPIYVAPRHTTIIINRTIVHRRFDPFPLRRYTVVHRHTTFDRRGTPRRDVGRNDRRDWDRGRDDNRRDWNRGRDDDRRDWNRGRDDDRREVNRGNGLAGGGRVAPVPTSARRVTPIPSGAPRQGPDRSTAQGNNRPNRAPTPTAGPGRNDRGTWNPRPTQTANQPGRTSTPAPQGTPRPQRPQTAERDRRLVTAQAPLSQPSTGITRSVPRQAQTTVPEAARRMNESRPTANRPAAPRPSQGAAPRAERGSAGGASRGSSGGGGSRASSPSAGSGGGRAAAAGPGRSGGSSAATRGSGSGSGRSSGGDSRGGSGRGRN